MNFSYIRRKVLYSVCIAPSVAAFVLVSWQAGAFGTARDETSRPAPGAAGQAGLSGLLFTRSAHLQPLGTVSIGAELQYFIQKGLLSPDAEHSRLGQTYSISWTPFSFLEAAFAINVTANNSVQGALEELQVTVGDPQIALKGGYKVWRNLYLGGLVDILFPAGSGIFSASISATTATLASLISWEGIGSLPINTHLNLGFLIDGSKKLFGDPSARSAAQRFAARVSSFHRFISRLGMSYDTPYVAPFWELSYEPFIGSGAPSAQDGLMKLGIGAHGWVSRQHGLQLLAAVDVGLLGVGDGSDSVLPNGKFYAVIPRWNLMFRLSYRFDAYAAWREPLIKPKDTNTTKTKPIARPTQTGTIRGKVVDAITGKPLWKARITIGNTKASPLAVSNQDAQFVTYPLAYGEVTLTASAEGYQPSEQRIQLAQADQEQIFKLDRKIISTGAVRVTVRSTNGAPLPNAVVLIPEADKQLAASQDGTFNIELRPGLYQIVVSAKGHRTQHKKVRILESTTVILNVELRSKSRRR